MLTDWTKQKRPRQQRSVLETKLSISGIVERYEVEGIGDFHKMDGSDTGMLQGKVLDDQGVARHPEGFSGPVGHIVARTRHLTTPPGDLRSMNLIGGQKCRLEELSTGLSSKEI